MSSSPCAACKFLRRKCTNDCMFAPWFPADEPQRFANVHKVFGASNVSKLLNEIEFSQRADAVQSLAYEAEARINDPVYGCVGQISQMQTKLRASQRSLDETKKVLASIVGAAAMYQMLQDPMLRAQYQQLAASSNPAMIGLDGHHLYKLQQEQHQRHQEQIGAHMMQQALLQSGQRQQFLLQQGGGGGGGGGQVVIRDRQTLVREQQKQLHGGAVVIRDATAQHQQIDSREAAALQAREEQEMYSTSYLEMHRQAQISVLQQQQQQAEIMRFQEQQQLSRHMEARGGAGTSGTAELSPILALGTRFNAMNPYHFQQQQEQQLLSTLQNPQQQPQHQEIFHIPEVDQQQELQQQEQQEIHDIQLFSGHNLLPPEPENGS